MTGRTISRDDPEIASALAACGDALRRDDRERYMVSLFFPPPARERLLALYAFNAEVSRLREQVREPMLGLIRLRWWHEAVEGAAAGAPRAHPVCLALALALAERSPPVALFDRLLTGRERDLEPEPPADLAGFDDYVEETGAVLGELAAHLVAAPVEPARASARAYAAVGLLRAAPFHAALGRGHLPRGVDPSIIAGRVDASGPGFHAILARGHLRRLKRARHDPTDPRLSLPLPLAPLWLWLGRRAQVP